MERYKTIDEIKDFYDLDEEITPSKNHTKLILRMFNDNVVPYTKDGNLLFYIGWYYGAIKNKRLEIKYYLKSSNSKQPHIYALQSVAEFYEDIENLEEMEKYFSICFHKYYDNYSYSKLKELYENNNEKLEMLYLSGVENNIEEAKGDLLHFYVKNKTYDKIRTDSITKIKYVINHGVDLNEIHNYLTVEETKIYLLNVLFTHSEKWKNESDSDGDSDDEFKYFYNDFLIDAYYELFLERPLFYHYIYKKFQKIVKTIEPFTCPISLCEYEYGYKLKNCGHVFSCQVFNCDKCPLCREYI